jgi:very-short-patch-repair endonuclease
LGLNNISRVLSRVPEHHKKKFKVSNPKYDEKKRGNKKLNMWFVDKKGREYLIEKSRKKGFMMGVNKEAMVYNMLKQLFHDVETQRYIKPYYVDYYIPDWDILIEYDEKHHDKEKDLERENKIGEKIYRIKEGSEFRDINYIINRLSEKICGEYGLKPFDGDMKNYRNSDEYDRLQMLVKGEIERGRHMLQIKKVIESMGYRV